MSPRQRCCAYRQGVSQPLEMSCGVFADGTLILQDFLSTAPFVTVKLVEGFFFPSVSTFLGRLAVHTVLKYCSLMSCSSWCQNHWSSQGLCLLRNPPPTRLPLAGFLAKSTIKHFGKLKQSRLKQIYCGEEDTKCSGKAEESDRKENTAVTAGWRREWGPEGSLTEWWGKRETRGGRVAKSVSCDFKLILILYNDG